MAHVFFANKLTDFKGKSKKKSKEDQIATLEKQNTKENAPKTSKKNQSWGDSMGGLFKLAEFIGRNGIYRIYNHQPFEILNGVGQLFGQMVLGKSKSSNKKVSASLKALYPAWNGKQLKKYTSTFMKYMGTNFMDFMFRLPHTCDFPGDKFKNNPYYEYEGLERLDAALKEGKGVIMPQLHIGEFFHAMSGVFQHPNHYYIGGIAQISNLKLYVMNNRKHFDNLHVFASTDFVLLEKVLERFLHFNGILGVFHDYASPKQLKVPFIYGQYPYMINVPQSYISLQRKTGAVILPCIALPNKTLGKSKIVFVDNTSIMDTIKRYERSPKREFHGQVSTEINRVLYPYIKQYAHVWEELMSLASIRLADKLEFEPNISIKRFLEGIQAKMIAILENTFEPEREDEILRAQINDMCASAINQLHHPDAILRPHQTKINLSQISSVEELVKLASVACKELKINESGSYQVFMALRDKIKQQAEVMKCYQEIIQEEKIDITLTDRIWATIHGAINKLKGYEEIITGKLQIFKEELKVTVKVASSLVLTELAKEKKILAKTVGLLS